MIIAACIDCGAKVLYSEDLPAIGVDTGIKILNPF